MPNLFSTGQVVATPGALAALEDSDEMAFVFLARHVRGDWGDMDKEDKATNDTAVKNGDERVFSAYHTSKGVKLWVITEADRSSTCVLLPDEY